MDKFKGTGVALVTPFNLNGKVDYNGLQKLVEFQIKNGTNYLVVQGTTGESVTLSLETAGKEQSDKLIESFQKKNIRFSLLT